MPLAGGRLGEVVRLARRRANMTQAQLAGALGYSQSAVSRLERETVANSYDVRTLRSLASVLEIPASLLGVAEPPPTETDPVQRRDFLRVSTAVAATVVTGGAIGGAGRLGTEDAAEIQQGIEDLRPWTSGSAATGCEPRPACTSARSSTCSRTARTVPPSARR